MWKYSLISAWSFKFRAQHTSNGVRIYLGAISKSEQKARIFCRGMSCITYFIPVAILNIRSDKIYLWELFRFSPNFIKLDRIWSYICKYHHIWANITHMGRHTFEIGRNVCIWSNIQIDSDFLKAWQLYNFLTTFYANFVFGVLKYRVGRNVYIGAIVISESIST